MLMSDGHYDRAQVVLDGVDVEMLDDESHSCVSHASGFNDFFLCEVIREGARVFQSIHRGGSERYTHLCVCFSKSHFGLKQYEQAVEAFEKSGHAGRSVAEMYFLWSSALYELGRIDESWDALEEGEKAFPKKSEFLRQKFLMMVRLGFYQSALELGRRYVDSGQKNLTDYLALASALTQAGQSGGAREILEQAWVPVYPERRSYLASFRVKNYLKDDANYPAADLMQRGGSSFARAPASSRDFSKGGLPRKRLSF